MASATATLVVRRPPRRMRDAGRSYRIELDGEPRGHVGPGETQVWQVSPGKYRVQAKIDWTGSAPLEVDLVEGTTVWLIAAVPAALMLRTDDGRQCPRRDRSRPCGSSGIDRIS